MKLKRKVTDINAVPEQLRALYEQQGDAYVLTIGVDGEEPVDGLKSALEREKTALRELKDKFKGVDLEEYQAMVELKRKADEKKLLDAGQIDELVNQRTERMRADYEAKLAEAARSGTALQGRLSELLIDGEVKSAAVELGVRSGALEDVIARARRVYSVDGDKVVPRQGDSIIMGKDGTNPMSVKEWLGNLAKDAGHLFETSSGGGAGGAGRPGPNGGRIIPNDPLAIGQNLEAIATGKATVAP